MLPRHSSPRGVATSERHDNKKSKFAETILRPGKFLGRFVGCGSTGDSREPAMEPVSLARVYIKNIAMVTEAGEDLDKNDFLCLYSFFE